MIKVTILYVISGTYALNLFFFIPFRNTSPKLDLKQLCRLHPFHFDVKSAPCVFFFILGFRLKQRGEDFDLNS